MDYTVFQDRLVELMNNRGLTMKSLSEELNIAPATLSRYLTSDETKMRAPTLPYVVKIAQFFDVSIDWILGFDDDKYAPLPKDHQELIHLFSISTPDDRRVIDAVLSKYRNKE